MTTFFGDNNGKFKTGDKVQLIKLTASLDLDYIKDGEILAIEPAKIKRDNYTYWKLSLDEKIKMEDFANVKWDDGSIYSVSVQDIEKQDSDLERQFRLQSIKTLKEIHKALEQADEALSKAEELSEKHGIPFYSSVSRLRQGYTPSTIQSLYAGISNEFVRTYSGVYNDYDEGWEHSQICY